MENKRSPWSLLPIFSLAALLIMATAFIPRLAFPTLRTRWVALGLVIEVAVQPTIALVIILAALIAGATERLTGMASGGEKSRAPHWVIPSLGTLVGGLMLFHPPLALPRQVFLITASLLPIISLLTEIQLARRPMPRGIGSGLLQGLGLLWLFSGFLSLAAWGLRALFSVPLTFALAYGISWRLLSPVEPSDSRPRAALHALLTAQSALALHYWLMPPIQKGLLLGLVSYSLWQVLRAAQEGRLEKRFWLETAFFGLACALTILILS
jgi:hypothetical protein